MTDIRVGSDVTGAMVVSDAGLPGGSTKVGGAIPAQSTGIDGQSGVVQKEVSVVVSAQRREKLDKAISQLTDYVQSLQRDLHFNVDESSGRMVIRVVDRQTKELVRQIPEEVVLDLAHKLNGEEPLRLFSATA